MLFAIALPVRGPDGVQCIAGPKGLIDDAGDVVVPPIHLVADVLGPHLACVGDTDRRLLDGRGQPKDDRRWRSVGVLRDGLLAVRESAPGPGGIGGEVVFLDEATAREVVRVQTDAFDDQRIAFSEGLCAVLRGGKWGYVDRAGRLVIPCRFDDAGPFSLGLASVSDGELTGFITPDGAWAIEPRFLRAWAFDPSGVAAAVASLKEVDGPILRELKKDFSVKELRGMWGLIDRSGAWVRTPAFDYAETELHTSLGIAGGGLSGPLRLCEGRAIVRQKKTWGVIDGRGEIVVPTKLIKVGDFEGGLAAFQKKVQGKQRWGFMDPDGHTVIEPQFRDAHWPGAAMRAGRAAVAIDVTPEETEARLRFGQFGVGSWGYIDTSGTFVIAPELVAALPFRGGLAEVAGIGWWGYLDRDGRTVWRTELPPR